MKKCYNCGTIKKTTFNCDMCKRTVCLGCYNFVLKVCANCEVKIYNEKYEEKINAYATV